MHLISAVCSGLKNLLNKRDDVELEIKNYYFSLLRIKSVYFFFKLIQIELKFNSSNFELIQLVVYKILSVISIVDFRERERERIRI